MPLSWPWNRSAAGAGSPAAGTARTPDASGTIWPDRTINDDWQRLSPLQRSFADLVPVAPLNSFTAGLTTARNPSFLQPLGHLVSSGGPGGLVTGIASLPAPHPVTAGPELALAAPREQVANPIRQRTWSGMGDSVQRLRSLLLVNRTPGGNRNPGHSSRVEETQSEETQSEETRGQETRGQETRREGIAGPTAPTDSVVQPMLDISLPAAGAPVATDIPPPVRYTLQSVASLPAAPHSATAVRSTTALRSVAAPRSTTAPPTGHTPHQSYMLPTAGPSQHPLPALRVSDTRIGSDPVAAATPVAESTLVAPSAASTSAFHSSPLAQDSPVTPVLADTIAANTAPTVGLGNLMRAVADLAPPTQSPPAAYHTGISEVPKPSTLQRSSADFQPSSARRPGLGAPLHPHPTPSTPSRLAPPPGAPTSVAPSPVEQLSAVVQTSFADRAMSSGPDSIEVPLGSHSDPRVSPLVRSQTVDQPAAVGPTVVDGYAPLLTGGQDLVPGGAEPEAKADRTSSDAGSVGVINNYRPMSLDLPELSGQRVGATGSVAAALVAQRSAAHVAVEGAELPTVTQQGGGTVDHVTASGSPDPDPSAGGIAPLIGALPTIGRAPRNRLSDIDAPVEHSAPVALASVTASRIVAERGWRLSSVPGPPTIQRALALAGPPPTAGESPRIPPGGATSSRSGAQSTRVGAHSSAGSAPLTFGSALFAPSGVGPSGAIFSAAGTSYPGASTVPNILQRSTNDAAGDRHVGSRSATVEMALANGSGAAASNTSVQRGEDPGSAAVAAGVAEPDGNGGVIFSSPTISSGQVQRADITSSQQPAPSSAPSSAGSHAVTAPTGVAGPAGGAVPDLDELARRLFDPLSARLKTELWLDRERAGLITDLRR